MKRRDDIETKMISLRVTAGESTMLDALVKTYGERERDDGLVVSRSSVIRRLIPKRLRLSR